MKKFVSLGAALMTGVVLAREKPTAFQTTVASRQTIKENINLHRPVAISDRDELSNSPMVQKYCTFRKREAIRDPRTGKIKKVVVCYHCSPGGKNCSAEIKNRHEKDGTPDQRGSRWTSILTDYLNGTSPSISRVFYSRSRYSKESDRVISRDSHLTSFNNIYNRPESN